MFTTTIQGTEYPLATTLRVAYKVQGQHNHMPYAEVFKRIGDMGIEEQINILYAAFQVANPDQCKTITAEVFRDYYLDNYDLKTVMEQLQEVIKGITGATDEEMEQMSDAVNPSEGNLTPVLG